MMKEFEELTHNLLLIMKTLTNLEDKYNSRYNINSF